MHLFFLPIFLLTIAFSGQLQADALRAECLYAPCCLPDQVNYFLNSFAEKQKQASGLVLVTKNGESERDCCFDFCCDFYYECKLDKIALIFDYFGEINLATARHLILNTVTSFLHEINQQEKVKPFFCKFPLSMDQISIQIRIRNESCRFYPYLGNISMITIDDGSIIYGTINSYTNQVDVLRRETYEEAVQLSTPR